MVTSLVGTYGRESINLTAESFQPETTNEQKNLAEHITTASRDPKKFARWVSSQIAIMEDAERSISMARFKLDESDTRNCVLSNMMSELTIARHRLRKYGEEHHVLYSRVSDLIYAVQRALSVHTQVLDYIAGL